MILAPEVHAGLFESCVRWLETGRISIPRDRISAAEYELLAQSLVEELSDVSSGSFHPEEILPAEARGRFKPESGLGYDLARNLLPLRPYRALLELTDWEGFAHFERNENLSHTTVLNALVGRPRNTGDKHAFTLALTQVAGSNQIRLSFAFGPYPVAKIPQLKEELNLAFGPRVQVVSGAYLLVQEFPLTRACADFMKRLIHNVQDRYFKKSDG